MRYQLTSYLACYVADGARVGALLYPLDPTSDTSPPPRPEARERWPVGRSRCFARSRWDPTTPRRRLLNCSSVRSSRSGTARPVARHSGLGRPGPRPRGARLSRAPRSVRSGHPPGTRGSALLRSAHGGDPARSGVVLATRPRPSASRISARPGSVPPRAIQRHAVPRRSQRLRRLLTAVRRRRSPALLYGRPTRTRPQSAFDRLVADPPDDLHVTLMEGTALSRHDDGPAVTERDVRPGRPGSGPRQPKSGSGKEICTPARIDEQVPRPRPRRQGPETKIRARAQA